MEVGEDSTNPYRRPPADRIHSLQQLSSELESKAHNSFSLSYECPSFLQILQHFLIVSRKDSAVSDSRMSGFASVADAPKPQMTIAQIFDNAGLF